MEVFLKEKLLILISLFLTLADPVFAICGLTHVLEIAGLPLEESYYIEVDIEDISPDEVKTKNNAVIKQEIEILLGDDSAGSIDLGKRVKYCILTDDEMLFAQAYTEFSNAVTYDSFFYDCEYAYHLRPDSGELQRWDNCQALTSASIIGTYLELLGESIKLQNDMAIQFRSALKLGPGISEDRVYMLPASGDRSLFSVWLSEKEDLKAVVHVERENLINKTKKRYIFNIRRQESVKEEIFIPNGFGDVNLTCEGENFSLFVRDFLPSAEELEVLMRSVEAKREYEAEARNRPRVGPINKYSKPMDLSQYK